MVTSPFESSGLPQPDSPPRAGWSRPRVTQQCIANEAGVNRATVSMALREVRSIPESTRRRIQEIARRMGYVPDPMLGALASYRRGRVAPVYKGVLTWLAQSTPNLHWQEIPHVVDCLAGAKRRATERGYSVEVLDLEAEKMDGARASSVVLARGIRGVLVCPLPEARTCLQDFPWHQFSAVSFGYSLSSPRINSVTSAHHDACCRLVREFYSRGYRRIGAAICPERDGRIDHNLVAGYLTGCNMVGVASLPICPDDGNGTDGQVMREWIREAQPDCIISSNFRHREDEVRHGHPIRREVPVACPTLPRASGAISGIVEQSDLIGQVATDLLIDMIYRGETGLPAVQQRMLVDGVFHAAADLPPRGERVGRGRDGAVREGRAAAIGDQSEQQPAFAHRVPGGLDARVSRGQSTRVRSTRDLRPRW